MAFVQIEGNNGPVHYNVDHILWIAAETPERTRLFLSRIRAS